MAGVEVLKTTDAEAALTQAEREARKASISRARAQADAGDIVSGEAVFEWLASWGTDDEMPAPKAAPRGI